MKSAVGPVVSLFRDKGYVTEAEMDRLNIPVFNGDTRTIPKDQRVLHQQRAVLMSGTACIQQYRVRKENIIIAAEEATHRAAAKEAARLEKLAALAAKREATETKRKEAEAHKKALKQLKINMAQQKARERDDKKRQAVANKKRQLEEKAAQRDLLAQMTPAEKRAAREAKRRRIDVNIIEINVAPEMQTHQ
jgi:hypothetical protein